MKITKNRFVFLNAHGELLTAEWGSDGNLYFFGNAHEAPYSITNFKIRTLEQYGKEVEQIRLLADEAKRQLSLPMEEEK